MENRSKQYAKTLSKLIQAETISRRGDNDRTKFHAFQHLLCATFPHVFGTCEFEDFDGGFVLRWRGKSAENPVLLMNHQDVVEANGNWKYPPFAGEIAEGKVWGRGTLDTKGGLFGMLQAADELISEGFEPNHDVYFASSCEEEVGGAGADKISQTFLERGIRFRFVLDEGGMIITEPIAGAKGAFAMVGVGEKGFADLKFVAKSAGGHASTPPKDTPLVRLGKFMAAAEKKNLFRAELSPTVAEMFARIAPKMEGVMGFVLAHARALKPLLVRVMPKVSTAANAMLKTTLAFTMAGGADGTNVLPQEAWVVGNMRYSHHQGKDASIREITEFAAKYGVETQVIEAGIESPLSSYETEEFALIERAVKQVYPEVVTSPYVMTGASDSRYMSRVSDNCLRFTPFLISDEQMESIHAINENVDVSTLAPAVDFYRYVLTEA
ncbi:MAG: M20/M25/M40 family metallo-hydrolase [Clostridia bacterium]|nr:M20/M25/M40 family metallo-hydrolase [Clostridia bacterium]